MCMDGETKIVIQLIKQLIKLLIQILYGWGAGSTENKVNPAQQELELS